MFLYIPNRDTFNFWALITFFSTCYIRDFLLILSPSCFAICCGHHLSLG